jgi:hypothetical protein
MKTWGLLPIWMRDDIVQQAKEMEKEQIMDAYWEIPLPEEKYFEKTFKSEKDENKR